MEISQEGDRGQVGQVVDADPLETPKRTFDDVSFPVSATSSQPRSGEKKGKSASESPRRTTTSLAGVRGTQNCRR